MVVLMMSCGQSNNRHRGRRSLYLFAIVALLGTAAVSRTTAELVYVDIGGGGGGSGGADDQDVFIPEALNISSSESSSTARIVGGTIVPNGGYPWFGRTDVVINGPSGGRFNCGCTLIAPRVAVSALHCIGPILTDSRNTIGSITIYFDDTDLDGQQATVRTVTGASYDANGFSEATRPGQNDIILYKLNSPVTNISPIPYNRDGNVPATGSKATAIGFGLVNNNGQGTNVLREVILDVADYSVCSRAFSGVTLPSDSELICTFTNGKGTCNGDSGGPLVATVNGQLTLIGLTSFGGRNACGVTPSGYVATSHHQDDIAQVRRMLLLLLMSLLLHDS